MRNFFGQIKEYVRREDTYTYRGWLVSDKFMKRFLAFVGYTFLALMVLGFIYDLALKPAF